MLKLLHKPGFEPFSINDSYCSDQLHSMVMQAPRFPVKIIHFMSPHSFLKFGI